MISEWKEFLARAGAEFTDSGVAHYGNLRRELSVALTGNVFADLSHYGLISVHGDDAETFLQGQLTNDIRKVNDGHSQLTGLCNPKGRLLATFRAFHRGDSYYLCLPAGMLEDVIKRLRMFVLRSSVTLEDTSDTFVHLGISGQDAAQDLGAFVGELPASVSAVVQSDNHAVIQVPGIHPSYEIFTTVDDAMQLWDRLNVQSAPIGADAWQLLDIEAGIPVVLPQTREAFVPQMMNLQLVDGVSFQKGCYTGQEIVARMQYLGKLKRRMYLARVETTERPDSGEEIFASDAEQSVGKLISVAPHPDGGYALLAVLQIASAEAGTGLHLGGSDGPLLELKPLPYPMAED
ncbi:MAG: YgfZ/GcvT domain-containing protein [Thiogranum sp.]